MAVIIDTSNDRTIPLDDRVKPCPTCGKEATFSRPCGAWVCGTCQAHAGLTRCYCGWSRSGGNGRRELEDMGENIGEDYE